MRRRSTSSALMQRKTNSKLGSQAEKEARFSTSRRSFGRCRSFHIFHFVHPFWSVWTELAPSIFFHIVTPFWTNLHCRVRRLAWTVPVIYRIIMCRDAVSDGGTLRCIGEAGNALSATRDPCQAAVLSLESPVQCYAGSIFGISQKQIPSATRTTPHPHSILPLPKSEHSGGSRVHRISMCPGLFLDYLVSSCPFSIDYIRSSTTSQLLEIWRRHVQ